MANPSPDLEQRRGAPLTREAEGGGEPARAAQRLRGPSSRRRWGLEIGGEERMRGGAGMSGERGADQFHVKYF